MIGYLLELELGNRLPADQPLVAMLTMIEVDPDDPAFDDPTKPIGPIYEPGEAAALPPSGAGRSVPTATTMRRVVASPAPKRIFEQRQIALLLEAGLRRDLRRRRRHPRRPRRRRPPLRRRGRHRQGPRQRAARPPARRRRVRDGHRHRRRLRRLRHAGAAARSAGPTPTRSSPSTAASSPPARCCPRSPPRATSPGSPASGPSSAGSPTSKRSSPARRHRIATDATASSPHTRRTEPWHSASTQKSASCDGSWSTGPGSSTPGSPRRTPRSCSSTTCSGSRRPKQEHDAFCEAMRDRGVEVLRGRDAPRRGAARSPTCRTWVVDHVLNERQVGIGARDAGPRVGRRGRRRPRSPTSSSAASPGPTSSRTSGSCGSRATPRRCCCRRCPNFLFQRDPSCWIFDGVTLNPMTKPARKPETMLMEAIYRSTRCSPPRSSRSGSAAPTRTGAAATSRAATCSPSATAR